MFVVVYEFKVKPDADSTFREGWARVTDALRAQRGTLGSRLHKTAEGVLVAYAQWPDEDTFNRSVALGALHDEPGYAMMKAGLTEAARIVYKLDVVDDRLR